MQKGTQICSQEKEQKDAREALRTTQESLQETFQKVIKYAREVAMNQEGKHTRQKISEKKISNFTRMHAKTSME